MRNSKFFSISQWFGPPVKMHVIFVSGGIPVRNIQCSGVDYSLALTRKKAPTGSDVKNNCCLVLADLTQIMSSLKKKSKPCL